MSCDYSSTEQPKNQSDRTGGCSNTAPWWPGLACLDLTELLVHKIAANVHRNRSFIDKAEVNVECLLFMSPGDRGFHGDSKRCIISSDVRRVQTLCERRSPTGSMAAELILELFIQTLITAPPPPLPPPPPPLPPPLPPLLHRHT